MPTLRLISFFLVLSLVLGFGTGGPASAQAAQGGQVIHEGIIDGASLIWEESSEGQFIPRLTEADLLEETGKPVLAVQQLRLLVPADASIVGIEVIPLATHQVPLPGQLKTGEPLLTDSGEQIQVDRLAVGSGSYPEIWGEYGGTQVRRGFRMVSLLVYPLRAIHDGNGNWTALEVLDRYRVRLLSDPDAPQPDIAHRMRLVPGERERTEAVIRRLVANPGALAGYVREDGIIVPEPTDGFQPTRTPTLSGSAVQYLIITTEALAPSFQVLANYKTAMGIPSVIATREWIEGNFRQGADIQETMRMFIREAYQRWGTEYVLLAGDTDVLPCRYNRSTYWPPGSENWTDIPTDLYFCCLDGNWNADGDYLYGEPYTSPTYTGDDADLDDEVYLGRLPVNTVEEATLMVNKIITYTETPSSSPWTNRSLWIAEVLFWTESEPQVPVLDGATFTEGIINDYLVPCTDLEYTRMYELYEDYPGSVPLTREALIDSLNTGHYHIFDQVGHGFYFNMHVNDANFTNADADALTNGDHYLVIYALNCASAAFDQNCLMERFLLNPNGGAVATLGSSRAAFPYTTNDYQEGFFDNLYCGAADRLGELISLSRAPFLPSTYYNTVHRWTYMVYCLLGDPTLSVWTGHVDPFQISAPSSLSAGQQVVNISLNEGGSPVAGALVCLAKNDDDYVHGTTNASGVASLEFTPTGPGDAVLTVTGHNLAYSQQTIPVSTGGPYVAVAELSVVDNGNNGSIGNGNSAPEAGERLALYFEFEDTGGGGATNCNATLSTSTPGITLLESMVYVGNVPSGGLKMAEEPFLLEIDPTVMDGQPVDFDLVVTSGSNTYEDQWTMTALAPEIEPVELAWEDTTHGNGNGIIENGEEVRLTITLKNFGVGRADNVTAVLRSADPQITLGDTLNTYVNLDLLDTSIGSATFSLSDSDVSTLGMCWILFEDNHGRTVRHDFQLTYPATPGGLEADSTLGPDVIALWWLPVQNPYHRGYHVYRSLNPGGPFTRVNVDLVDGVSYYRDENLAPLTRYYYRVSAVDSSLVEGPLSAVIDQSTSPPEKTPFPLPFARDTSGHPAVGDVNGDGRPNIVLGADEIYVWTDAGGELFDGDENAQTHGPITNLDLEFQPAGIALYPLDGVPGLEIIASELQEKKIHIFRWDGTELPGWPQNLGTADNSWNWATPAVGDVDGDGDPEIVVHSQDGLLWVWHHDGTELADGDGNPATNGVFQTFSGASYGKSSPALCDLDGDGAKDIILGTCYWSGDNYLVAYRYDGNQVAGFPYNTGPGRIQSSPTVADLNRDGIREIAIITKGNELHVVQQNGTAYPGFPIPFMAGIDHTPSPAVGNFDADNHLEIAAIATVGGMNADLYVIDTDPAGTSGQPLSGWPQQLHGASEASPVVGDIDGDGTPDIVHGIGGLSEESPNNLYAYKANGEPVDGFPITLGAPLRNSPIICDLDYDGDVDIVYGSWDLLMHVWDLPFDYDPVKTPWPTFRGHFYRDGVHRTEDLVEVTDEVPGTDLFVTPPYPNPFNPSTSIRLYVPGATGSQQQLEVHIYDLRGRRVSTLHDGPANVGWHTLVWDGRNTEGRGQASGVYFLRARSTQQTVIHKMSLVK